MMAEPEYETNIVVSGIVRRGGEILLVRQFGAADPHPNWFLPGGRCEPGETLLDALLREVREEAGLEIDRVGPLVSIAQSVDTLARSRSFAFVFEVEEWSGTPRTTDPDGLVSEARFFPLHQALAHLGRVPWPAMREPLVHYLRGHEPNGTVWIYSGSGLEDPHANPVRDILPGAIASRRLVAPDVE